MAVYDPKILQRFADNLYSKADSLVAEYVLQGVLLGLVLAVGSYFALTAYLRNESTDSANFVAVIIFVVCAVAFYFRGKEKAFELRLEAQRTLCQLQLEKNTRNAGTVGEPPAETVRP